MPDIEGLLRREVRRLHRALSDLIHADAIHNDGRWRAPGWDDAVTDAVVALGAAGPLPPEAYRNAQCLVLDQARCLWVYGWRAQDGTGTPTFHIRITHPFTDTPAEVLADAAVWAHAIALLHPHHQSANQAADTLNYALGEG